MIRIELTEEQFMQLYHEASADQSSLLFQVLDQKLERMAARELYAQERRCKNSTSQIN